MAAALLFRGRPAVGRFAGLCWRASARPGAARILLRADRRNLHNRGERGDRESAEELFAACDRYPDHSGPARAAFTVVHVGGSSSPLLDVTNGGEAALLASPAERPIHPTNAAVGVLSARILRHKRTQR